MHDRPFSILPVSEVPEAALRPFVHSVWGSEGWLKVRDAWWIRSSFGEAVAAVENATKRVAGVCVAVPSEWGLPDGRQVHAVSICGWYVAPEFNGKGLGKMLVRSFEGRAQCMNALSISDAAVTNFAKLGWNGPYSTWLRLLPFPAMRRSRRRRKEPYALASWQVRAGQMPAQAAAALDRIDQERPANVLRRKRRAADWTAFLAARPTRRLTFSFVFDGDRPVGYFVVRSTDEESGKLYRLGRLHFVSDLVLNTADPAVLEFLLDSIPSAAPASAGALLLCTTSEAVARAASERGWMGEESRLLGRRLGRKAPKYMLGGDFLSFDDRSVWLTFVDSDVDLNI